LGDGRLLRKPAPVTSEAARNPTVTWITVAGRNSS